MQTNTWQIRKKTCTAEAQQEPWQTADGVLTICNMDSVLTNRATSAKKAPNNRASTFRLELNLML